MKIEKQVPFFVLASALLLLTGCSAKQSQSTTGANTSARRETQVSRRHVTVQQAVTRSSPRAPLVFSHRGSLYDHPEHSFAGYDQAIKEGSAFIEQDVRLSADGTLFVSHDDDLTRTLGESRVISTSHDSVLQKLRLTNGEPLHRLTDVFRHYKRRVHYIVEVKHNTQSEDSRAIAAFSKTLAENNLTDNVIIQDTSLTGLRQFHGLRQNANVPTLWLADGKTDQALQQQIAAAPDWLTYFALPLALATPETIHDAHAHGLKVCVWTLSEFSDNKLVSRLAVDAVFTNTTGTTVRLLKAKTK